jgi:hypothetical protein
LDSSCHQSAVDKRVQEAENDQHLVLDSRRQAKSRVEQGAAGMAKEIEYKFEHNPLTDVMFVDIRPLEAGSIVETMDIGQEVGFPGQVQVRVDPDRQILYGLTIQNYTSFRRKLFWRYGMASVQRAIQLFVSMIIAGLRIEQNYRPHQLV